MRRNLPVTDREVEVQEDRPLISATNDRGVIEYVNDAFLEVSGYERDELIGQAHNIIRHPDMPQAAFRSMWETLQAGQPWMGMVKNRCKNGDFYWVSAYVTPIRRDGRIIGFESVRHKPRPEWVRRATRVYQRLNQGKPAVPRARLLAETFDQSLPLGLTAGAALIPMAAGATTPVTASLTVVGLIAGSIWHHCRMQRWLQQSLSQRKDAFADPLIAATYSPRHQGWRELDLVLVSEKARLTTVLERMEDLAGQLSSRAAENHQLMQTTRQRIGHQRDETDQTASAINEMTSSISEVSQSVNESAARADEANTATSEITQTASRSSQAIDRLNHSVEGVGDAVSALGEATDEIGSAAQLITDIADQTNLLALNAAIEAARAGEQGRGFAVVADEVRNLASRTRESTERIHEIIGNFKQQVQSSLQATEASKGIAREGLESVQETETKITEVAGHIDDIASQAIQMASAVEEQSQVAEQINQQITRIAEVADETTNKAGSSAEISASVETLSEDLYVLVERFKNDTGHA